MPQLAPREWSRQANKLQIKAGRPLDRADLIKELGKPNGKVTRAQSIEKGGRWNLEPATVLNRPKYVLVVSVLTPQMPQENLQLKPVNKHECKVKAPCISMLTEVNPLSLSTGKVSRLEVLEMIKTLSQILTLKNLRTTLKTELDPNTVIIML